MNTATAAHTRTHSDARADVDSDADATPTRIDGPHPPGSGGWRDGLGLSEPLLRLRASATIRVLSFTIAAALIAHAAFVLLTSFSDVSATTSVIVALFIELPASFVSIQIGGASAHAAGKLRV